MSLLLDVARGGSMTAIARRVIARPRTALVALARILGADWRKLSLGGAKAWVAARQELEASGLLIRLQADLDAAFADLEGQTVRGKAVVAGGMRALHAELLWALVRHRKPAVVVETGVCNGLSSAIILSAMERNGHGRLISVDLPEFSDPSLNPLEMWEGKGGAVIPRDRSVGWLVPETCRPRWSLVLGKSEEVLPGLLAEAGPIDVFIHDSEHSYANQLFEFTTGYTGLRSGGLLVATDLNWSAAFEDFWKGVKKTGARRAFVDHSGALVAKP